MLIKDPNALPDKWGKRPSDRSVGELLTAGVIALDKPRGPTSHQVTAWVRDAVHADKVGHGGTLDPYVSGILPICLGRAVRLTDLVLSSHKEYICLMTLHGDVPEAKIKSVLKSFQGKIYQMPPVRSAIKRQLRIRNVEKIEILEIEGRNILFKISCDAGTYVRTICTDVGEALGCGANMLELRRPSSGVMNEKHAATLHDIVDAYTLWQENGKEDWIRNIVMPMEVLVEPLPKIIIKASAVDAICHGADLNIKGIHKLDEGIRKNALVALMTARGELVAIGKMMMSTDKVMSADQGKAVEIDRVLMDAGHYPKMWHYSTDLDEIVTED